MKNQELVAATEKLLSILKRFEEHPTFIVVDFQVCEESLNFSGYEKGGEERWEFQVRNFLDEEGLFTLWWNDSEGYVSDEMEDVTLEKVFEILADEKTLYRTLIEKIAKVEEFKRNSES